MRDDFSKKTIKALAQRASYACSNPDCNSNTQGPDSATGTVNIGVAAHITAASVKGPRYDPLKSREERQSLHNGIWL